MRRVVAFAVCGLTLGACTSGNLDMFKLEKSQATVRLESEPAGAEAKLSTGATCKTPCALPVDADVGKVTVTYALEGYQPQELEVNIVQTSGEPAHVSPDPAVVELEALPSNRRRPAKKRSAPKKPAAAKPAAAAKKPAARRPAAAKQAPAPQPAAAAAPPPPPAAAAPATTQSSSPWPAPAATSQPAPAPWPTAPGQAPAQQ
jgi:hypothetical protein